MAVDVAGTIEGAAAGAAKVAPEVGAQARQAVASPWAQRLTRFGYATRGALYALVGVLAAQVARNGGAGESHPADQRGALETIAAQPLGTMLLAVVVAGLAAYAMWGLARAILDPLGRGTSPKGLAQRFGYLVSALSYGGLLFPALALLRGARQVPHEGGPAGLMQRPYGPILVGVIGGWLVLAALTQLWQAYAADFRKDFRHWDVSPEQLDVATRAGRFGYFARGVVYGLVGFLLVRAAVNADGSRAGGLDAALQTLAAQPHGTVALAVIALGLVSFGVFSLLCAFWLDVRPRAAEPQTHADTRR